MSGRRPGGAALESHTVIPNVSADHFSRRSAQLERYRALLRTVESSAMSAEDSRAFIHRIAREL
ncbi:Scr1 family TA system antitoxin-like transcriptional regulator [Streptomyces sp. DSM 41524]|uniref:Scr1 family TA system antitoxin-like transcriptional regulator n=1 Tax=Streptomyces asiaticus subsp. ignotus TaxID=3098222 RepID=A0ABU7Q0L1_9ACTN|nr:Scr1 family TA system antitoxin-like transcriptional regulator [Streptomyces sp. DSM 41524]